MRWRRRMSGSRPSPRQPPPCCAKPLITRSAPETWPPRSGYPRAGPVRGLAVQRGAQPPGARRLGRRARLAGLPRPGGLVVSPAHPVGDGGPVGRGRGAGRDRGVPPGRTGADDPGRLRHRRHLHRREAEARGRPRRHAAALAGQRVGPGRGRGLARPVRRLHRLPPPGAAGLRAIGHLPGRSRRRRQRVPAVRHRLPDLPGRPGGPGRPGRPRAGRAVVRARPDPAGRDAAAGPGKQRDRAGGGDPAAPTRGPRRTPAPWWSGCCSRRARCTSGASGRHGGPSRSGRTWWRPGSADSGAGARPAAAQRRREPPRAGRGPLR